MSRSKNKMKQKIIIKIIKTNNSLFNFISFVRKEKKKHNFYRKPVRYQFLLYRVHNNIIQRLYSKTKTNDDHAMAMMIRIQIAND